MQREQSRQQDFAAPSNVMNEREESQMQRQLFLGHAAMRTQPRAKQGPETFHGIDIDFPEPIPILILGIRALFMVDRFMGVAPGFQRVINGVFIGNNERSGGMVYC